MEDKVKLKRVKHSTDEERYVEACKVVGYTYDEVARQCFGNFQNATTYLRLLLRVVEASPTWLRDSLTEEEWEELQRLVDQRLVDRPLTEEEWAALRHDLRRARDGDDDGE